MPAGEDRGSWKRSWRPSSSAWRVPRARASCRSTPPSLPCSRRGGVTRAESAQDCWALAVILGVVTALIAVAAVVTAISISLSGLLSWIVPISTRRPCRPRGDAHRGPEPVHEHHDGPDAPRPRPAGAGVWVRTAVRPRRAAVCRSVHRGTPRDLGRHRRDLRPGGRIRRVRAWVRSAADRRFAAQRDTRPLR